MYPYRVSVPQPSAQAQLEQQGISPLVSKILSARGVTSFQESQKILYPGESLIHDPFLLEDMDKAVQRIQTALEKEEFMAVYGDYDVDGVTATSLLSMFLKKQGAKVIPYIPQRSTEGYGLNHVALEELYAKGVRLIITVDCGVSGKEQVEFATKLGMDVIITDHHSCPAELPQACAVVNPSRGNYPFPPLAGVGVALKLAQALSPPSQREAIFQEYSDLVAVGTVADVMPMEGENRYFVRHGLVKLNQNPNLGLDALLVEIGAKEKLINTGTIGYNIAPRINAAGRLDRTEIALDLLLTQEEKKATDYAIDLCLLNSERQDIESEIFKQCLAQLEEAPPKSLLFLSNKQWHPGVVGIVASRLGERFHMPTIMVCCRDGIGKGSCRTFGSINLYELLTKASDLLLGFGGHAQAAGFTVAEENLPALEAMLRQEIETNYSTLGKHHKVIDTRLSMGEITLEEVYQLELLEPTGATCPRPKFLMESAQVVGASLVGGGKHLRLRLQKEGKEVSGIFFHYVGTPVYMGAVLDLAFHLQINHFRGVSTPQMQIFSMSPSSQEDKLYQTFQQGGQFTQEDLQDRIPSQEEITRVQEALSQPIYGQSVAELWERIEHQAQLPAFHGELAVGILRESGLVALESQPPCLRTLHKEPVDLSQNAFWALLESTMESTLES